MKRARHAVLVACAVLVGTGTAAAQVPTQDRAMGHVYSWGQELREQKIPGWTPTRNPFQPKRWYRIIEKTLTTAGQNGLWFSGSAALPFDLPIKKTEPRAWLTRANFMAKYRATGLSWDVNLELKAAKRAFSRHRAIVWDSQQTIQNRRLSILDPGYQKTVLQEIRRLVPRYRSLPYVSYFTGLDEPQVFLPRGRGAAGSKLVNQLITDMSARYGWTPPSATADPDPSAEEGLRWLAFSRYVSDRFFALKAEQTALIRKLDPQARISPASFGFIDGFMPWDYTKLSSFADVVEGDPYVSFDERENPGRGRYNPGFVSKFLSDLTGRPVRTIVQAFPYNHYAPVPGDLYTWTAQALRAGATDISLYGETNPRYTNRSVYSAMLDIANRLRGTRLPPFPADPSTVLVYSTASEGQAQPEELGENRYRTRANELYTTYALLGELAHSAFVFDSDTRLAADPSRLAAAHTVWLPRGDTLDRPFAQALLDWVRKGGTLVVTDPQAFTRTPDGGSLGDVRDALVGAPLDTLDHTHAIVVGQGTLGPNLPAQLSLIPVPTPSPRAFASVPSGASVVGRYADGSAGIILRTVGAGQVLAFAGNPMEPSILGAPLDLVTLVAAIQAWRGAPLNVPAWSYKFPSAPATPRLPWKGSYAP